MITWARAFLKAVTEIRERFPSVTEDDIEDLYNQWLLDDGHPIEFQDPEEVERFLMYAISQLEETEAEEQGY